MGARSKDGLALVGQVSHIGELMAVELEHCTERLLFIPLSVKAVLHIIHIHEECINLRLVVDCFLSIVVNFSGVQSNIVGAFLIIILSLCDPLSQLQHLKSESLDCDDLVRVDVNLLLVAVLVSEWLVEVV